FSSVQARLSPLRRNEATATVSDGRADRTRKGDRRARGLTPREARPRDVGAAILRLCSMRLRHPRSRAPAHVSDVSSHELAPNGEMTPMADETISILDGSTFVVSARSGDIDAGPDQPHGLFFNDTRFLDRKS